ncbi:hypothetical protein KFK09_022464 [Dendrobium nobile]|uniref:Uncharacterized protein n=1 Tax=Dendrobium nobile TaxID=94219 RepID=A0A8T3AIM2_DENNO|nr:hypothetical protein KFK09_022464 [Dendrobium nobile]
MIRTFHTNELFTPNPSHLLKLKNKIKNHPVKEISGLVDKKISSLIKDVWVNQFTEILLKNCTKLFLMKVLASWDLPITFMLFYFHIHCLSTCLPTQWLYNLPLQIHIK